MLEKMKTGVLISLIILSMILTYHVWFGVLPSGNERMEGYEYLLFAEPYSLEEIVTPSEIIISWEIKGEDLVQGYVFRPGEENYRHLWTEGAYLLKSLEEQEVTWISPLEKDVLRAGSGDGSAIVSFRYATALPIAFLVPELSSLALEVQRADFIPKEDYFLILLEGGDAFCGIAAAQDGFMSMEADALLYACLPDVMTLDLEGYSLLLSEGVSNVDEAETIFPIEYVPDLEEPAESYFTLTLKNSGALWVPAGDLIAPEIVIVMEDVDRDQLVKALFFDQSIARRIEERDGAVFFTDGEKGLRVYPNGIIEYTAPKLEQSTLDISFNSALQKGAENLDFFGGWFPGTYLVCAEAQEQGYQLLWENYFWGFPLQGEDVGSEMMINGKGVFYYKRNFYNFLEEVGQQRSFQPFEEALYRAALIYKESSQRDDGILLGIEPVYYLSSVGERNTVAVPAWSVLIEGMEKLYLHWQSLEPL